MELPKVDWHANAVSNHVVGTTNIARRYHRDGMDVLTPEVVDAHATYLASAYCHESVDKVRALQDASDALRDAHRIVQAALDLAESNRG